MLTVILTALGYDTRSSAQATATTGEKKQGSQDKFPALGLKAGPRGLQRKGLAAGKVLPTSGVTKRDEGKQAPFSLYDSCAFLLIKNPKVICQEINLGATASSQSR